MSTRAQICIKRDTPGFKETGGIYIYKHCDGYPEGEHGVLRILKPFVERFVKARGNEPDYLLCQIVREFAYADPREPGEEWGGQRFIGWGLDTVQHGDIEYLYEVDSATGIVYVNGKAST
jgi:hypothetical protein